MNGPDGRVETRFKRGVQLGVFPINGKLMREMIGIFRVTSGVLHVGRFQREMPVAVDAQDHAFVQAKAAADQDGEADRETGSDA